MAELDAATTEKKLVRVTIFQQPYTLRSSGAAGETEALAEAVDQLMNQIASRGAGSEPTRVAVLACLHLADRLRHLERELDAQQTRLANLDEKLEALLDQAAE